MDKKIVGYNIAYYSIFIFLISKGRFDPSSSLGYGILLLIFWLVAGVTLLFLLKKNIIVCKSFPDRLGILIATPILPMLIIAIVFFLGTGARTERYFTKDNYRYKALKIMYSGGFGVKRTEFYRSKKPFDTTSSTFMDDWIKDSIWAYYSKEGDTIKIEKYKNDIRIY